MQIIRTLVVGTVLLASCPAYADDEAKFGVDIALQFAQCAGLDYAVADLGPEAGYSSDKVQFMHELGNGAAMVAKYLLTLVRASVQSNEKITPEGWHRAWDEAATYIDDQVASNRVTWRVVLRDPGSNPRVQEQASQCGRLNPLQAQLVQEMRQNALTAPVPMN
jgi:hypothetical protein